ncbi:MAG: response regulator, partial [Pseudomonadota bacterium]
MLNRSDGGAMAHSLVVDDEPDMLLLLRMLLDQKTNHQVDCAGSGLEARQMLSEHPYDLVITDMRMPDLEGLELMALTRGSDPALPFIFVTGFGSVECAVEAVRKGAFDYITKPFRQEQLLLAIERALAWREAASLTHMS